MYGYNYGNPPGWLVVLAVIVFGLIGSAPAGLLSAWVYAIVTRDSSARDER